MDISRMLDVVKLRFQTWNPIVSTFGENGFRVEFDNYNRTGRILLRCKIKFESLEARERFVWDVSGQPFKEDEPRVEEIKRVVAGALI